MHAYARVYMHIGGYTLREQDAYLQVEHHPFPSSSKHSWHACDNEYMYVCIYMYGPASTHVLELLVCLVNLPFQLFGDIQSVTEHVHVSVSVHSHMCQYMHVHVPCTSLRLTMTVSHVSTPAFVGCNSYLCSVYAAMCMYAYMCVCIYVYAFEGMCTYTFHTQPTSFFSITRQHCGAFRAVRPAM
jgi:hypothetical protein